MNGMIRTENISKKFRSMSALNQVTLTVPGGRHLRFAWLQRCRQNNAH